MRLMPMNGAYPAQLADQVYASDPAEAKSLLQRAVTLNRYDASSWIQLGLLYEAGNDLPQAEAGAVAGSEAWIRPFFPAGRSQTFIFDTKMLPASGTGRKEPPRWLPTTQPPCSAWPGTSVQALER